jgi:hypothetical protein
MISPLYIIAILLFEVLLMSPLILDLIANSTHFELVLSKSGSPTFLKYSYSPDIII